MAFRWSGKRVKELLEELSDDQKNFKTKPSGRRVSIYPKGDKNYSKGDKYVTHGYFRISGAYGGWELQYVYPYSTAVMDISPGGHISSGKLADYLLALGSGGLKMRFRELEKVHKPLEREYFNRLKAEYRAKQGK